MDTRLGGGGRGRREADIERKGKKQRKETNQGERRERDIGRNMERQEGNPQSHRPSISSPQSHPSIPEAAGERRGRGCGSAAMELRWNPPLRGPNRLPPLSWLPSGARSLRTAGLAQCAPSLPRSLRLLARLQLWESSWERRTGVGGPEGDGGGTALGRSWERSGEG